MTTAISLPYQLARVVTIAAAPETVFSFFTDSERWARWWGAGSTIEPRPGGRMLIRHANGIEVAGEVLSVEPPRTIVFTYGFVSGAPVPVGGSRVTIELQAVESGTQLRLTHDFAEEIPRNASGKILKKVLREPFWAGQERRVG